MNKLFMQAIAAVTVALSLTGAYAFTDVPYITTSTAKKNWLLLDYKPNQDTIIETTVAIPAAALAQNKNHAVFCARGKTTSENTFTSFFLYSNNKTQFRWDYSKTATGAAAGTVAADTPYVITYNIASQTAGKRCFSVASGAVTNRYGDCNALSNWEAANKLMLFASYTGETTATPAPTDNYATFKVYGVRIWDGAQTDDKLLYDLRPCIDGSGVYCLRDAKNADRAYYSKGGNNFDGSMGELKVSVEDFSTCVPQVSLSGMDFPGVTSVTFESAPTAGGPWTAFATVNSPEGGVFSADYDAAVVSVPVYYRAVVNATSSLILSPVAFTRFRRLERDPANETGGLVEGCSKMSARCTNAFDGKPETFPDVNPMEIGIDFGEEGAFVACVRALPRYNNTGRMNGAKLYAADVEDLSDAVAVSPGLSCSGMYTEADAKAGQVPFSVAYAQNTSFSHRFFYLYQAGWYGNVAEMQLYGWTAQDQKQSGELIPPTSVSVKFGDEVGSVVVSWIDGENIETLDLQRRVVGTEEWLTAASDLTGSTYTDKGLAVDRTYEYRLVAQGKGKTLAVPGESSIYLYATGGGTGLRGVIWGPIASASCRNSQAKQCTYHEFLPDAAIDFNRGVSADVLYASTNLTSGLVIWRGKLVVPMDGEYTIGIEVGAYDGYALAIDGTELANRYTGTAAGRKAVAVVLTAGEHPIEVQWASRAYGGVRKCRLFWALEGKIPEEPIPASQLKPAADSELPVYFKDGLNFALPISYGMYDGGWGLAGVDPDAGTMLPSFDGPSADGTCQILARSNGIQSWVSSIFGRQVKRPFRAELTVRRGESSSDSTPGLYLTGPSPIKQMIAFVVKSDGGVHLYATGSGNMNVWGGVTVARSKGNSTQTETKIGITCDRDGTLHFECKNDVTGGKWVECYTYVGGTNCVVTESGERVTEKCSLTGETIYVGFGGNKVKSVAHDLTIVERDPASLVPPKTFTLERGAAVGSVVVTWVGGDNIETCDINRRVAGTEEWTLAGSGLTGSTFTDTNVALDQTYEYRVVAHGNGETLPTEEVKSIYLYAVGGGTGLRGVIWGPIASPSCRDNQIKQCTYHEFRTDAVIDFDSITSADVLYASTNLTSGLVTWRGKLVVPTDGEYTIGIEVGAYDGYVLMIDGTEYANRYTGTAAGRKALLLSLTAGEHPIEVRWASRANGYIRKCRLFWSLEGKIDEEPIPVTQLKPAADSELPVYFIDGMNFAFPLGYGAGAVYQGQDWNVSYMPHFDGVSADGTIQIRAGENALSTGGTSFFGRPMKGPFRAELTVRKGESDSASFPGLYLTGSSSPARDMIAFVVKANDCGVHLYPASAPNVGVWGGVTVGKAKGNSTQTETKLRVTRDDEGTLRFFCRNEVTDNKWVECYTYVGGTNCVTTETEVQTTGKCTMEDETIFVGFGGNKAKTVGHDLKIEKVYKGMMVIVQ